MPSEEFTAEIESAIDNMMASGKEISGDGDSNAEVSGDQAAAAAASDDAKVMAEVAANDEVADKLAAENKEASEKLAKEEGGVVSRVAKDAQEEIDASKLESASDDGITPLRSLEVNDEILARAVSVGIPVADARELDRNLLGEIIEAREAAAVADDAELEGRSAEGAGAVSDPFADLPKLNPENYEPEVVQMFDRLTGIAKQQHKTIEGLLNQQTETAQAAQAVAGEEIKQWFDTQVTGLGEEFAEALGGGDYDSLDRGSSQFAKREAIANQMSIMFSGYEAQGLNPPPRGEVFDAAARLVLRDEYQKVHERKLTGDLGSRATQHIQRAGGTRASSTQTPEEEAAAAVDAMLGNA